MNLVFYQIGFKTKITTDVKFTSKLEISSAIAFLNLGASFEMSVEAIETQTKETTASRKTTYTIAPGDNFWVCQRSVDLNVYLTENAVTIFDLDIVVNGLC